MAAHILTAMNRTLENIDPVKCKQMVHGLQYARFGDLLEISEWTTLKALFQYASEHEDYQPLRDFYYTYVSPRLWQEWENLDQPETCEEWFYRKYKP